MAWSCLLGLVCIMQSTDVLASTGFDGGCRSISQDSSSGKLLATDENGKVFSGTLQNPVRSILGTSGNVNSARYVLGGSRILLIYRSGALELVDASDSSIVLARAPAFSYADVQVSRDGRWALGLLPGGASVDVLELSSNAIKAVRRYDHPLGAAFTSTTIASESPVVALLDEKSSLHLVNWKTGQLLPTPQGLANPRLRKLQFIFDDLLWATVDAGLMPIGSAFDLTGRGRSLEGMAITRNARVIAFAEGQTLLALDDLGFTDILQRTSEGTQSRYARPANPILARGLHEAVANPSRELVALCGYALEVVSLSSGARVMRVPSHPAPTVFVDNVTPGGEMALVRDREGRAAIWSVPQARYLSMLPRLRLQVFPAWAALNPQTKAYLAFGQADVLSVSRPVKSGDAGVARYAVAAVPLSFEQQQGEVWESVAAFAPDDGYTAYVVRPEAISKVTWSAAAVDAPPALARNFIRADASPSGCAAFSGRMVVSDKGNLLAVACVDGIAVYDTKTLRRVAFIRSPQWAQASARLKVWVSSLAFSPGGTALAFSVRVQRTYLDANVDQALSANAPTVYVHDFRTATLKAVQTQGQVPVTAVAFSPDGGQLWVGGRWGELAAYGAQQGNFLWRQTGIIGTVFGIAFDSQGDAVVWTDAGLLAKVRPRDRLASTTWFLDGGHASGGGPTQTPASKNVLQLASPLPPGFLNNPRQGATLELSLKAPPAFEHTLQSLLYVDGKAIAAGRLVEPPRNGVMRLAFQTQGLVPGSLSVGVFSQGGGASPALVLGDITAGGGVAGTGKLVGAFVGIGKYDDPALPPLPLAASDARALATALQQDGAQLSVFPQERVPSKGEVMQFLAAARDSARPEDTLMLFISGHGLTTRDNRFLLPAADTRLSDTSGPRSGISAEELLTLISAGRQGDTILVLDTCESSAFIGAVLQHPILADGPLSLGGNTGKGLTNNISVLAAAAPLQVAKEGYAGRGLLTGVLIDGLKGPADDNRDGKISQRELMNYVDRSMVTVSRKAFPTQPQEPVLHYGTTDIDLIKVRLP